MRPAFRARAIVAAIAPLLAGVVIAAPAQPAASVTPVPQPAPSVTSAPCRALLSATFLQPSYKIFSWSRARYDAELADMSNAGIKTVILQWSVDMDANQAYYPAPSGWYPRAANMVGTLLPAAAAKGMSVWLGLGNVYSWQAHAGDRNWLANQLYVDERIADQLWALYANRFAGWYISNEVDDVLLSNPTTASNIAWFFSSLTAYLHTHAGNRTVMTSPTYSGLHQSTTQFAASSRTVLGSVDVLNVQDGGGAGYIGASDITNWFTALHTAFAGTNVSLWQDADMYAVTGGPMSPTQLQSNLRATCGMVSARAGFSFSTQMGPRDIGTSTYYNAYVSYRTKTLS